MTLRLENEENNTAIYEVIGPNSSMFTLAMFFVTLGSVVFLAALMMSLPDDCRRITPPGRSRYNPVRTPHHSDLWCPGDWTDEGHKPGVHLKTICRGYHRQLIFTALPGLICR